MKPSEAPKELSSQSELLDSLKVYLTNKNRLQPIIGLGSIIECVKVGACSREVLYLCEVCVCRLGKADMRNHIMGSLHRYKYIKALHPHLLSDWKENSDLSKVAWPLMEIAKTIEGREGAGDVQIFEVEDAVFQRMATLSENDAVAFLRNCQGQPEKNADTPSVQLEEYPVQSQRIVLLARNQQRWTQQSLKADFMHNPPLKQSAGAPHMKTESCLTNTSAPQLDSCSFLSVYTGTKPLIGLFRVVECRSDSGHTCVFLCHCCRVRFNKRDFIGHLTSSSHLSNYLMETHPEQVELLLPDNNDHSEFLQSLAKKVEREEGRGELKVINVPESLCVQLTGKSYHWCIKMLSDRRPQTSSQTNKITVKGVNATMTMTGGMPEKHPVMPSKRAKKITKKEMANTVFKVSLPLKKGPLLLERMSFSEDDFPMVQSPASGVSPSPVTLMDGDDGSLEITHTENASTTLPEPDLYSGDAETNTAASYQEVNHYFPNNEYSSQQEDKTGTDYQNIYQDSNDARQYCFQETCINFEKDLNHQPPQNVGWSYGSSHTLDWSSYGFSHRREGAYTQLWYDSASQNNVGMSQIVSSDNGPMNMMSDAPQFYQQLPQNQYMAQAHNNHQAGCVGHHGSSAEATPPYVDAARFNMYPYLGNAPAHNATEIRPQAPGTQQRQMSMEFLTSHVQTTPQSYVTQPVDCQVIQMGHSGMYNHNYYHEPNWHVPYPHNGGGGALSQSGTFTPPVHSTCYGSYFV